MAILLSKTSKKKKIQERPRILHNDFSSNHESILNKSGKSTLEVKRLRTPALEVFTNDWFDIKCKYVL